jgi:hypothetical protein
MTDQFNIFGVKATEQIAKTVREVSRRMMNPRGQRGRWQGRKSPSVITNVRFQIVSSDPTTFTGLAEVLAWDYGFTLEQVPDLILGSVIEICDPRACFLNEPNVDLTGRQGTAVYRQGVADDICRTGYEPFPGVWEVDGLCCRLLSCDVVI